MSLTLGIKSQRLTPYQRRILTENFQVKPYLEMEIKNELARLLNISKKTIADWFYRMRRTKHNEKLLCIGEYSIFKKNSFMSVVSEHITVIPKSIMYKQ